MSEPKVLATLSEPFLKAQNVLGEGELVHTDKVLTVIRLLVGLSNSAVPLG